MLGINCLIKNTDLHELAKEAVNILGDTFIANGIVPTVKDIWSELRANNIEVDISTVGHLYMTELSTKSNEFYQAADVEKQASSPFRKAINKMLNSNSKNLSISQESPVEAVANGLSKLFNSLTPSNNTKSVQKDLQDILMKGMRRLVKNPKANIEKQSFSEIVNEGLGNMMKGFTDVNGNLNSLKQMHVELKREVSKYLKELGNKDAFVAQQYKEYVDEIMNSTYQIMFNKSQANQVVTDAIKNFQDGRFVKQVEKTLEDGTKQNIDVIDWKEFGRYAKNVTDLENIIENVFENEVDKNGKRIYDDAQIQIIKQSISKEYQKIFHKSVNRKLRELDKKLENSKTPVKKYDLERIADLQSLGAFDSNKHQSLIYEIVGASELQQDSLKKIEEVGKTINSILDNVKNPVQAKILFNQLQSDINLILHNNITSSNNKVSNVALKAIKHFNLFTQAALTGILQNIGNMVQNVYANSTQMLSTSANLSRTDFRYLTKNFPLFWRTFSDVGFRNGLVDGLQTGEFNNDARLEDYMRKSFKDLFKTGGLENKVILFYKAVLTPFRLLGSSWDAAAKAVNTKKLFTLALDKVLKEKYGKNKEQRYEIISDALYNGNLVNDSIKEAEKLIELSGGKPNKDRAYRMAQNIMAYKLADSGTISEEDFNSILESAFNVSGMGLGHKEQKTNNVLIRFVNQTSKGAEYLGNQSYLAKVRNAEKNNKLGFAMHSMLETVTTALFTKFVGGSTRWIPLTVQTMGFGIFSPMQLRKKLDLLDSNGNAVNQKELTENLEKILGKNEAFFRGLVGLALAYTTGLLIKKMFEHKCADGLSPEECKAEKESAANYIKDKIVTKTNPHAMAIGIANDMFDKSGTLWEKDTYKKMSQLFNVDNAYSSGNQIKKVAQNLSIIPMDNPKQKPDRQEGLGALGKFIGQPFTNPLMSYFKAYDEITKGKPQYEISTDWKYGMLSSGLIERTGGLNKLGIKNDGVTGIAGVSGGKVEALSNYNIRTKEDLRKYINNLEDLKMTINPKGKEPYEKVIFNAKERAAIIAEFNKK